MGFKDNFKDEDKGYDYEYQKKFPCCEVIVKCFCPDKKKEYYWDDEYDYRCANECCEVIVKCAQPKKKKYREDSKE